MFMKTVRLFSGLGIIVVLLALASCKGEGHHVVSADEGDTLRFKYATLLRVVRYPHRLHVEILNPWKRGSVLHRYDIDGPRHRAVVSTTAHCQLLCWLGASGRIAGVCDARYIQVDEVKRGLAAHRVANCGNAMNPDVERMVSIGADAILVSPIENSRGYGQMERLGIPIIEAADYMEPSPLARAEWMRFYGLLFGCEERADSLFKVVERRYRSLCQQARQQPLGRTLLVERKTGDVWYCPGGRSTIGTLIAHARGRYPWSADTHSGSLPLSAEKVLTRGAAADVWMFAYAGKPITRTTLLSQYAGYGVISAFRHGEVYACNTDSVRYFEETPFRPDYLLHDYLQILHPQMHAEPLRYYKRIDE